MWWDEEVRLWADRDYPVVLLGNGTFGLYSQLRRWVGTEGISYMFYDSPKLVHDMLEFATEFFLQLIEPVSILLIGAAVGVIMGGVILAITSVNDVAL